MNSVILLLLFFLLGNRQDNNETGCGCHSCGNSNDGIQPRNGNSFTRPFMTFGQGNTCSCEVQSDS